MSRGVKAGTRRGHYKRFNKPRLQKLAIAIRAGRTDCEAVAQAFESVSGTSNTAIAQALRAGAHFDPIRLASALEKLGAQIRLPRLHRSLPLWMVKAALLHQRKMPLHKALRANYPYSDDTNLRSYLRQMRRDFGPRAPKDIERQLNDFWPSRIPGQFPELEQAIREALSGPRVPLAVYRAQARRTLHS